MQARVKETSLLNSIRAFAGHDYNKKTWEPVPDRCIEEVERGHSFLDFRDGPPEDEIELADLTVKELQALAKIQGIKGHGRKKADLVAALEGA